ncbi:hypothetical protein F5Y03DRAFT_352898 [Xylaria venustula]|nr:hypothetical protein F5Y03DRAFT_352898 [Xylaria venustula]
MAATIKSFSGSNSDPREFIDDVELAVKYNEKDVARVVGYEFSVSSDFQNSMVDYIIAAARKDDAEASLKRANDHRKVVEDRFEDVSLNYHETNLRTETARGILKEAVSEVANHSKNGSKSANSASNSAADTVKATLHAIDYARFTIAALKSVNVPENILQDSNTELDKADGDAKSLNRQGKASSLPETGFEFAKSADNIKNAVKAANVASNVADMADKAAEAADTAVKAAENAVKAAPDKDKELDDAKSFLKTAKAYKEEADRQKSSAKKHWEAAKSSSRNAKTHQDRVMEAEASLKASHAYIEEYKKAQTDKHRANEEVEEATERLKAANSAVANSVPAVVNSRPDMSIAGAVRATEDSQTEKEQACLSVFRNHLAAEAKAWHSTLSRDVRGDWRALKFEFLQRFKTAM